MYRSIPCKSFGFLDLGLWDEVSFGILIVKAKIIRCRTKEGVGRKKDSPSDAAPQGGNESSLVWIRYWGGESQPDELVKGFGSMPSAIASRKVKLLRISFFFFNKRSGECRQRRPRIGLGLPSTPRYWKSGIRVENKPLSCPRFRIHQSRRRSPNPSSQIGIHFTRPVHVQLIL